jgi:pimeloyl-ACP methyl ester carboxylesterase
LTVNWQNGASKLYPASAANTRVVGAAVAKFLEMVRDKHGAKMENVHVVGHSLGAQTGGYIGQRTPNMGRITGFEYNNTFNSFCEYYTSILAESFLV